MNNIGVDGSSYNSNNNSLNTTYALRNLKIRQSDNSLYKNSEELQHNVQESPLHNAMLPLSTKNSQNNNPNINHHHNNPSLSKPTNTYVPNIPLD